MQAEKVPPGVIIFLVVASYILGHLVAHLASFLTEHVLLRGCLGSPEEHIFKEKAEGWRAYILTNFFKPFPPETRKRVLEKARGEGIGGPGRGLFYHCFATVKRDKSTSERLASFLTVYGFCRNVSMACLLAGGVLLFAGLVDVNWKTLTGLHTGKLWWALGAFIVAIGLFLRYLKYFRHYTDEVFRDYAVLPSKEPQLADTSPPASSGQSQVTVDLPEGETEAPEAEPVLPSPSDESE
ncbi:hypothetical protein GCM10023155_05800 [Bremerella cremea]